MAATAERYTPKRVGVVVLLVAILTSITTAVAATLGGIQSQGLAAFTIAQAPVIPVAWTVVQGAATISGTSITATGGGNNRIKANTPLANVTVSGKSQQTTTNGYSVLVRGSYAGGSGNLKSGYTVSIEPATSRFTVRQWRNNVQCAPMVSVPFYGGFSPTALNNFSVTVNGNTLSMVVNGNTVINIPSLTAAETTGPCPTWVIPQTDGDFGFIVNGALNLTNVTAS